LGASAEEELKRYVANLPSSTPATQADKPTAETPADASAGTKEAKLIEVKGTATPEKPTA
jgi:hypothetical protein